MYDSGIARFWKIHLYRCFMVLFNASEKVGNIKLVADKMNLADDLTVLNRLSDAYKNMKLIDRNYSNQNETVLINLKEAGSDKKIQVEIRFPWRKLSRFYCF